MSLYRPDNPPGGRDRDADRDGASFLSPTAYDDDASSLHSRSDQEPDSDDDQMQLRARNSRELRAADRLVLMEEEEMDRLVTDTRRRQERERERRGSGLSVPNPISRMLGRVGGSVNSSADDLLSVDYRRRRERRLRRERKKERLMEGARNGEDGELIHEMEEGGMKGGSSTGESSDREGLLDDDDGDDGLGLISEKTQQRQSRKSWVLIYGLIAIVFALLAFFAWRLSNKTPSKEPLLSQNLVSNGTALFGPTTIIISLDGFRADFLQRGITPKLDDFVKAGVSTKYMLPSFPSVTFPNHYTIATGLYPESHGIVGNQFWDPDLQEEFYYTDPARSMDPKWWGGEPFWVTAEKAGVRSAIHMWPGSEAHVLNVEPSFLDKYNGKELLEKKVSRIMQLLDMPGRENQSVAEMRPQLIAAYIPNVDAAGHKFGPNSTEIRATIQGVDTMVGQILAGLETRNLTDIVNVMIVSDHGMATTDLSRLIQLEDITGTFAIEHDDGWPLHGLRPKNAEDLQPLYEYIKARETSVGKFKVYLRDKDMPERYHFTKNKRIAPLWIVPEVGWAIVNRAEFDVSVGEEKGMVYAPRGLHGYDHEDPMMRAVFMARGPAFGHPGNSDVGVFQNIEVYNLLCDSLGIEPKPNNGTLRLPLKPIGVHQGVENPPLVEEVVVSGVQSIVTERPTSTRSAEEPARPTLPGGVATDTIIWGDDDEDDREGDDDDDGIAGKIESIWDWVKEKVESVWDKISST